VTIGASVDLGSNSVHLLVAAIEGHQLRPLVDESVFLGLGAAVADRGFLGQSARDELVAALARYAGIARDHGAAEVSFIGTEPLRREADAARIVYETVGSAGVPMHVVSHEEEAFLTIIGVTEGLPVTRETLVVDIGGGSCEFCIVDASHRPRAAGLRLGSARLTDRFVANDPALTSTDRVLSRAQLRDAVAILQSETAAEASARHGINPIRARILPAGAVILDAILERYGVGEVHVSEAGIREGTILAVAHAGRTWRDRLPDLAHGWRT
jgi:exopolyphosphatase/pppGpp-phosphohydrolase